MDPASYLPVQRLRNSPSEATQQLAGQSESIPQAIHTLVATCDIHVARDTDTPPSALHPLRALLSAANAKNLVFTPEQKDDI